MAQVLAVSARAGDPTGRSAFELLDLLSHGVIESLPTADVFQAVDRCDLILLDGRDDLGGARRLLRLLEAANSPLPVLLVLGEGSLPAVTPDWGVRDIMLAGAGPAELDARIRLASAGTHRTDKEVVTAGGLVIDGACYSASLDGRPLDLTYTEFELLHYLAGAPGRVFSRETLLADVWGNDYLGGTRTVDVHVRRLRAKLGPEHEGLIGTVRNVGYRFIAG